MSISIFLVAYFFIIEAIEEHDYTYRFYPSPIVHKLPTHANPITHQSNINASATILAILPSIVSTSVRLTFILKST